MTGIIDQLKFMAIDERITTEWEGYKPVSWPPPDDFVMSIDANGQSLSRYSDNTWDFRIFKGRMMHFDGLDDRNTALLKMVMFIHIYHYSLFPGTFISLDGYYQFFRLIAKVCSENKISMDVLNCFPEVIDELAKIEIKNRASNFEYDLSILSRFLILKKEVGFAILEEGGLKRFSLYNPMYERGQYACIPPRIWNYHINRLDEVLSDFLTHEKQIKDAFNWLKKAYQYNQAAVHIKAYHSPFYQKDTYANRRMLYHGSFEDFASEYELLPLIEKYQDRPKDPKKGFKYDIRSLSRIFTLGFFVSNRYILSYSLMRKAEGKVIRFDGLKIDYDEKYGNLYMVESVTTKTKDDPNARWPVSSSVEKAFKVSKFLAELRMQFSPNDIPIELVENPYLFVKAYEPWAAKNNSAVDNHSPISLDYSYIRKHIPKLYDEQKITIKEADFNFAKALTPNLELKQEWFKVGQPWLFSDHQLRRTVAVQMAEYGVSQGSVQYCMKHRYRSMQLHYTKNHTRIVSNKSAHGAALSERLYQAYLKIGEVVRNEIGQYVQPYSKLNSISVEVMNLIEEKNYQKLKSKIKKGEVSCRITLLGLCMKNGPCEYGGIESISACMGEHDGSQKPCGDLIIDTMKKIDLRKHRDFHLNNVNLFPKSSPRHNASILEVRAAESSLERMEN